MEKTPSREELIAKYRIKSGLRYSHQGHTSDKVKELRDMGMSYNEIQDIIGCSKSTINYALKKRKK